MTRLGFFCYAVILLLKSLFQIGDIQSRAYKLKQVFSLLEVTHQIVAGVNDGFQFMCLFLAVSASGEAWLTCPVVTGLSSVAQLV